MGYGDFKMNAAVGAFLGWKMLPLVILLSSVVGLVFGALQMFAARGRWDGGFRFHFGPYLAIAGIVALFWGEPIVRWYCRRCDRSMTPFVVGLTGGIGSGKSAAADEFARLGASVVDTDAIAHELTAAGRRRAAGDRAGCSARSSSRRRRDGPASACASSCSPTRRRSSALEGAAAPDDPRGIGAAHRRRGRARTWCTWCRCWSSRPTTARRVDRVLVVDAPGGDAGRAGARAQRPAGGRGARASSRTQAPRAERGSPPPTT